MLSALTLMSGRDVQHHFLHKRQNNFSDYNGFRGGRCMLKLSCHRTPSSPDVIQGKTRAMCDLQ
ncbi:Uncharacterized protein dnm_015880 [Desulfonema magnum]|uniref:Uncharacterized protein n=1 Tax=Desulfonema magnum TaxID=45655 RepID=A0A975BHM3_9BACT|nr:Uncharacterized protein dnm_015880 [Desulfonema magnum]